MELAAPEGHVATPTLEFYRHAILTLREAGIECLVGGAYAFALQTRVERITKDFDLFIRPRHVDEAIAAARRAGFRAGISSPHWLAKIESDHGFIDVIFSSGNGVAVVDDEWFEHARHEQVLGISVGVCPPEEALWSKAFVMERDRYDGADVAHILLARADSLDWERLFRRFGDAWRVLFSHVLLFGFIFPTERARVPAWVTDECMRRFRAELDSPPPTEKICRGTLLSWSQYLIDLQDGGWRDARLAPVGSMTAEQIRLWTERPK
ncbi:MAG TPA: nucleotidyltransferase [Gemmatimonadales bacterium]